MVRLCNICVPRSGRLLKRNDSHGSGRPATSHELQSQLGPARGARPCVPDLPGMSLKCHGGVIVAVHPGCHEMGEGQAAAARHAIFGDAGGPAHAGVLCDRMCCVSPGHRGQPPVDHDHDVPGPRAAMGRLGRLLADCRGRHRRDRGEPELLDPQVAPWCRLSSVKPARGLRQPATPATTGLLVTGWEKEGPGRRPDLLRPPCRRKKR
jgi:hypothetical protein